MPTGLWEAKLQLRSRGVPHEMSCEVHARPGTSRHCVKVSSHYTRAHERLQDITRCPHAPAECCRGGRGHDPPAAGKATRGECPPQCCRNLHAHVQTCRKQQQFHAVVSRSDYALHMLCGCDSERPWFLSNSNRDMGPRTGMSYHARHGNMCVARQTLQECCSTGNLRARTVRRPLHCSHVQTAYPIDGQMCWQNCTSGV